MKIRMHVQCEAFVAPADLGRGALDALGKAWG